MKKLQIKSRLTNEFTLDKDEIKTFLKNIPDIVNIPPTPSQNL